MTITLKTNLMLWLLTGRSSGFVCPALNTFTRFPENIPSDSVKRAREVLHLSDTRTDFFALGAMAALYTAVPALRSLPEEQGAVFVPGVLTLPDAWCSVPLMPGADSFAVDLTNTPTSLNAFVNVRLSYEGGKTRITPDIGASVLSEHTHAGGLLFVPQAEVMGLRASYVVGTWTSGSYVDISVPPTAYPYEAVVDAVKQDNLLLKLMADRGTIEAFATTPHPARKLGALAAAVVLDVYDTVVLNGTQLVAYEGESPTAAAEEFPDYQMLVNWAPLLFESMALTYNPT